MVHVKSARARRVTHDSFDVETVTAVDGVDFYHRIGDESGSVWFVGSGVVA